MNRKIALEILNNQYTKGIFRILTIADDEYANTGEPFISDAEYDALRLIAKNIDPNNSYFMGIGSAVRTAKQKLPYTMGSLDQVQVGDIQKWVKSKKLENEEITITDKMDGISVLLVYGDTGALQIALTRGDGYEGQDITRHVKQISSLPKYIGRKMTVRAEIEFSNTNFEVVKKIVTRKDGSEYRNPRNCMAGLMNQESVDTKALKLMDVFAYDIMGEAMDKYDQLSLLSKLGFTAVEFTTVKGSDLTDTFLNEYISRRKRALDIDIDGIVIDIDDQTIRSTFESSKTTDSINPPYSIKYKVIDDSNYHLATVEGVEWNLSKHGKAKPRIKLGPFDLGGVTIEYTTGFNAKYIKDNNIGKGTVVNMTRSGDVIPYILNVVTSTVADMPKDIWNYTWNGAYVDLELINSDGNLDVIVKQIVSWATSLDIPNLKEGSVIELVNKGYITPDMIVNMDEGGLVDIIGKNGEKIYDGIREKLTLIPIEKLAGSYPSFGIGIGVRKFKKLQKHLVAHNKPTALIDGTLTYGDIVGAEGYDTKSADIVMEGYNEFIAYLELIKDKYSIITASQVSSESKFKDQKICFTGFRNKEWEAIVEENGGEIASGVTKNTTILVTKDTTSTGSKITKAQALGIEIISQEEFGKTVDK